jgi:hypothetical protein
MRNFRVRPLTVVCLVVAIVFIALAFMYFSTAAKDLPGFVPGHETHVTRHHTKHGFAKLGLAVVALIGAWFTTAPKRSESN